jgi:hypothetical protein
MVSRDGWVVYDDTPNFILDENDWWVPNDTPQPPRECHAPQNGTDVQDSTRSSAFPSGTTTTRFACDRAVSLKCRAVPLSSHACVYVCARVCVCVCVCLRVCVCDTVTCSAGACCAACMSATDCIAWVWESDGSNNCWPLAGWSGTQAVSSRVFGQVRS